MSEDILGYSSHDWRKNTDNAIVIDDKNKTYAKVNDCKVSFKNPKSLKTEEVDVSRLVRVDGVEGLAGANHRVRLI